MITWEVQGQSQALTPMMMMMMIMIMIFINGTCKHTSVCSLTKGSVKIELKGYKSIIIEVNKPRGGGIHASSNSVSRSAIRIARQKSHNVYFNLQLPLP